MVASAAPIHCPRTGYLQLRDGYVCEYLVAGYGEPIVLVPGLAGGIALLDPLIECLSAKYRVITYQLRGEERGLFERRFGFPQLVRDLGEIIERFGLERPGLVGASFGGAIALDFATRMSSRLSFLAVQGASSKFELGLFGDVARKVLDRLPLSSDNPFINQFFSVLMGGRRRDGDRFDFIVDRCWRTDQSVMAQRFSMLDDYDVENRIRAIRVPTLVLGGERDMLVPSAMSRHIAQLAPNARFQEVEAAGHLAFVTHAEQMTSRIREFQQDRIRS